MSMTFSLFEWVKDNLETILTDQPDTPVVAQPVSYEFLISLAADIIVSSLLQDM